MTSNILHQHNYYTLSIINLDVNLVVII